MKKIGILFLILLSVFLITGCGSTKGSAGKKKSIFDTKKTMTCTKEEVDEDGYKSTSKYVITYTSKKVTKVESEEVMTMDPTIVDWVYSFSYAIIEEIDNNISRGERFTIAVQKDKNMKNEILQRQKNMRKNIDDEEDKDKDIKKR